MTFQKGKKWSKKIRQKMSDNYKYHLNSGCFKKGKRNSPNTEFKKGQISWNKGKHLECLQGINHHNWKGGIKKHCYGYLSIYSPKHPLKNKNNYVLEHRLVMEEYLRKHHPNHPALVEIKGEKYLRREWIPHHKGIKYPMGSYEDRGDNKIKNLKLFPNHSKHMKFHRLLRKRKEIKK